MRRTSTAERFSSTGFIFNRQRTKEINRCQFIQKNELTPINGRDVPRGNPPGTVGLLCDPVHPALARFPTEAHTNWQWWHILMNSRSEIIDDLPVELRPIVQVIDIFDKDRNHRLGLIFEARLGRGKLLFCGSDLEAIADRPEARQLRESLEAYMKSPLFEPRVELTKAQWAKLFPATDASAKQVRAEKA